MTAETTVAIGTNVVAANGYTGLSQTQFMVDGASVSIGTQSVDKGGMRGAGLLAVVLAEVALKKKAADLAEDYYKTNKKDYDFFRNVHQGQIAASVAEAMSPVLNPTYNYDFYASSPGGIAKTAVLDKQWFEARRRAHRYAIGTQMKLDYDFAVLRVHGVMSGWNIGRRYEISWTDAHNNRRFDKISQVGNIGIGVGNIVQRGLGASVRGLATAYDGVGDVIATIGNGYAANSGYKVGRQDTAARYNRVTPNQLATSESSMRN